MPAPKMVRLTASSILIFSIAVVLCCSTLGWGSSPPDLGTVTFGNPLVSCPVDEAGNSVVGNPTCYHATISGCVDANNFTLLGVHPYIAVSTPNGTISGTIVLFNGGNGEDWFRSGHTDAQGNAHFYVQEYLNNHFRVVQVMWQYAPTDETWRDNNGNPNVKSLKLEACRPATLLWGIYQTFHGGGTGSGGMCAQGHSTGATAIAYTLAWYGAGSYLDNVVFTSGPPQADLQLGCQYPHASENPVTVCDQNANNQCKDSASSWPDCPQYGNHIAPYHDCMDREVDHADAANSVATFTMGTGHIDYTYVPNCNNTDEQNPNRNTNAFNSQWKDMSLVSTGATYDYPSTSMYAFLCATTDAGTGFPNNSAAQAWQYVDNIGQTADLGIYRVENCKGSEEIWEQNARIYASQGQGLLGFTVSRDKMINNCVKRH
jgi:hypothetical protein